MTFKLKVHLSFTCFLFFGYEGLAQKSLTLNNIDKQININGVLESTWLKTDSSSFFTQLEPSFGSASSRKTIIRAAQDKENIYFGFKCYLDRPDELVARIQRRDQLNQSDDIVSIILDTYDDNRTALLFQVNALGTVADAKISDDGKNVDYLWDTEWDAKAAISNEFWMVEIKIPLQSIQFKPGATAWGCNFSRSIRVNNEIVWWSPVTENNRVSQNGTLNNIQVSKHVKHTLGLFPYATGRYANANVTGIENGFEGDVGADIQYKYSSNLKANLTINPDFATVEGDKEQINLTPWELQYPEKRLFFQDGNEMFGTRIQTFYSRRIGDMQYGSKITGKIDKFQFNGIHAQTKGDAELQLPGARFNAFRIKGDVLKSSTLGLIYADKVTDTATFRSFNFDYVLNLGKTWKLTGQYVASTPGGFISHSAWFVRFARENSVYHYHVRFTNMGRHFQDNVNQTGFVPDDDRLEIDSDVEYKFWINKAVKYLFLTSKNNIFRSHQGILRSWYLTYGTRLYLNNKISFDTYYNNEFKLLDKKYYNHYYQFVSGYNNDETSHATLGYRFGRNFGRDFQLAEFNSGFKILKRLSVTYEFNYLTFSPDPDNESTYLNILGLDYYFTSDLWIHIFAQNNSSTKKYYFYGLFGWRFKPPFGALYLIVNTDNYYDFDRNTDHYSEVVFLKLTYPVSVIKR